MKGFGDNYRTNKKSIEKKTNSVQKDKLISNALSLHSKEGESGQFIWRFGGFLGGSILDLSRFSTEKRHSSKEPNMRPNWGGSIAAKAHSRNRNPILFFSS